MAAQGAQGPAAGSAGAGVLSPMQEAGIFCGGICWGGSGVVIWLAVPPAPAARGLPAERVQPAVTAARRASRLAI